MGVLRLRKTGVAAAPRAGGTPAWFTQLECEAEAARGTVGDCMARAFASLRAEEDESERKRAEAEQREQAQIEAARFSGELDLDSLMGAARARLKAQARRPARKRPQRRTASDTRIGIPASNTRIGLVFLASLCLGAPLSAVGCTVVITKSDGSGGYGLFVVGILTVVVGWWYAFKRA